MADSFHSFYRLRGGNVLSAVQRRCAKALSWPLFYSKYEALRGLSGSARKQCVQGAILAFA